MLRPHENDQFRFNVNQISLNPPFSKGEMEAEAKAVTVNEVIK